MHFEDLWIKCESLNKESNNTSTDEMLQALQYQITLYKELSLKLTDSSQENIEQIKKIKSRLFGEILFIMTNLSLKDDIDVFKSLQDVLSYRSIDFYNKKY